MRRRAVHWRVALLIPCLLTTNGCLVYRGDRHPKLVGTGTLTTGPIAPRVAVGLRYEHTTSGMPLPSPFPGLTVQASWERVQKETPFLANAGTDISNPEFVLDVLTTWSTGLFPWPAHEPISPRYEQTGPVVVGLCALLGVWPGTGSYEVNMRATLMNPAGETLGTHVASGQLNVVTHLLFVPFVPIVPFMLKDLIDDTFRDVLIPVVHDLVLATEDPLWKGGEQVDRDRAE